MSLFKLLFMWSVKDHLLASRPPCHVSDDLMRCSRGLSITELLPLRFRFVLDHNKVFAYVQGKSSRLNDVLKHSLRFQFDIEIMHKRKCTWRLMFDKDMQYLLREAELTSHPNHHKNLEKPEFTLTWLVYEKEWQNRQGKLLIMTRYGIKARTEK